MVWEVAFSPDRSLVYRPGQVIVRAEDGDKAAQILEARHGWKPTAAAKAGRVHPGRLLLGGSFLLFTRVSDPPSAVADLLRSEIYAQVNHVLFATPFYANPFYANPFYANPFYANPFYANPFYANPFYANPFYANPFYANASAARYPGFDAEMRPDGSRASSARPAEPASGIDPVETEVVPRVAILDTGYSATHFTDENGVTQETAFAPQDRPKGLTPKDFHLDGPESEKPDSEADGEDGHGVLDPAAGHGTFIAGLIELTAPRCSIEILKVIEPYGDGDEAGIAEKLHQLAVRPANKRPQLVNLSFGGYTPMEMAALGSAVAKLQTAGTVIVASAGNDGIGLPMYPAAFDEVIGVAALAPDGTKASFSNYGPWVTASTYGVNIISHFFRSSMQIGDGEDEEPTSFTGWARWSGTSFAAPRVVALLARYMQEENLDDALSAAKTIIAKRVEDRDPLLGVRLV